MICCVTAALVGTFVAWICYVARRPMPAPSKRPSPPARMVTLLAAEKRRLLAENGRVTRQDFETAWEACWEAMRKEHAWAHATHTRRDVRRTQRSTRRELRAAFLDEPTPFSFAAGRLSDAAGAMCLSLEPEQLGRALLAAMAYVEIKDEASAIRASDAASTFVYGHIEEGERLAA